MTLRGSHLSVTLLLALAGCGGGSLAPSPTPTPAYTVFACFASAPSLTLVAPVPGATGVPDNGVTLVLSGTLDTQYGQPYINFTGSTGGSGGTNLFKQTGPNTYTVALPNLAPATTYTFYYNVYTGAASPCNLFTVQLGSFTTQ
jgi:hypothetical protein